MMTIDARIHTDPACERSWAAEPTLRRLLWEFDGQLSPRWVMGGLARTIDAADRNRMVGGWLDVAARSRMPTDPRLWLENPISSTYPACQAVVAAREQGEDAAGRYLRRLREGIFCERKKLDHADALIAEAGAAGLDRDRFEIDLRSHASLEGFGADLERTREQGRELPTVAFGDGDAVALDAGYEALREAAIAAGATAAQRPPAEANAVIERFGRCATREIEEITGRPRPVVEAELWALARDWRLRPVEVLTGTLWERA